MSSRLEPMVEVQLNHPTTLPVYAKVHNYARHPKEGPPVALLSGGTGARTLSQALVRYTHSSSHVLPMFDDGGSSRELRQKIGMPPPGDLRNRLMALSDMTMSGNPEVRRLFTARLSADGTDEALQRQFETYLCDSNPRMQRIESRYRRIIINHLDRFHRLKPAGFKLQGGNIGNFVIAGAYLTMGDLESVIFEFAALAAVRGDVYPVCDGGNYHLQAEFVDGDVWVGQSRITSQPHPAIRRLAIVEQTGADDFQEVRPQLNPLAAGAIRNAALIAYTMGSFYTSIVPNLLVDGVGQAIRQTKRPKVFVANLMRDEETLEMTVSEMLKELLRYLRKSDSDKGVMSDYVHYALVGSHGCGDLSNIVPVDLEEIVRLGVEPIELPLAVGGTNGKLKHDPELVAAVLLSLC